MDRLELLEGLFKLVMMEQKKKLFLQIAHTLNKVGVINNDQLNNLIKEYVIYQYIMIQRSLHFSS